LAELTLNMAGKRAMVIFAHPDDAEYVSAGSIAQWTRQGCEVTYVVVTDGSKGTADQNMSQIDLVELRQREQWAAARVLGVKNVEFLGYEDGVLVPSIELRRDIVRAVRKYKPDLAVCEDPTLRWSGSGYINHPDHIAAAECTLAALFPSARDHLFFPELLNEGLGPHKTNEILIAGTNEPDVWVDISSTLDTKIQALLEHKTQVDPQSTPDFIRAWARDDGQRGGMQYAESFKYFHIE
jgi:LmbE family N-acetylglucosaminyl deacetylase